MAFPPLYLFPWLLSLQLFCSSASPDHLWLKQDPSTYADVLKVSTKSTKRGFSFTVTISSPDTGCKQYADWWEVVDSDGTLIYRRILAHSHVNEQPFSRSGGLIKISSSQKVWVRAHMNNVGYGGKTLFGSVDEGFSLKVMPASFATGLEVQSPRPSGCAF